MLAPTISAIASQNSRNMRTNTPLLSAGQYVTGSADVLDFRVLAGDQVELAAQVADVRVDAAVVGGKLAPQSLFGQSVARNHLSGGAQQQLQYPEFRTGQHDGHVRDAHLMIAQVEFDRPDLDDV